MYIQVKGKGWTGYDLSILFRAGIYGAIYRAAALLKVSLGIHGQGKPFSNNARKDLTNEQIGIY